MTRCCSLLCCSLFVTSSFAAPIVPGTRHTGPVRLEVPGLAVSFELPASYTAVLPPGTEWLHVGRDDEVGRVFVYAASATEQELRAVVEQPFPVADTVMLTPRGAPRESPRGFVADFTATDGVNAYGASLRVVTTSTGAALAFVAVAPPSSLPAFRTLAERLATSVRTVSPAGSSAAASSTSPSGGPWTSALADHRVVRYAHGSGYSEKTQFHLCRDGRFFRSFGATSNSSLGTGVVNAQNRGRWSTQGHLIVLMYDDGTEDRATLEDRGGQLFVNGERWLREPLPCS